MTSRSIHASRRGARARAQRALNIALGDGRVRARINRELARVNLELAVRPAAELAEPEFERAHALCAEYTMTSRERLYSVYRAGRYLAEAGIDGDVVECGVWRGGSSMMAGLALAAAGDHERLLWLYDTFTGMPAPTQEDVPSWEADPHAEWARSQNGSINEWCYSPLEEVRANMALAGVAGDRLRFVAGKVEDTVPDQMPERIAMLRLDTDWFESTRHELVHLFPRLVSGGVLILDDYGHWPGVRRAVDEYFAERDVHLLLQRVDYTGRMAIVP